MRATVTGRGALGVTCLVVFQRHIVDAAAQAKGEGVEQLLAELTNAPGAPGFEEPIARIMIERLKPLVNTVERDGWGGVIGTKKGNSASPRVMLDTHMDETGLIVKYIPPKGYVKFDALGGWL